MILNNSKKSKKIKKKNKKNNKDDTEVVIEIVCECQPGTYRIKGVCGVCGENEEYNPKKSKCKCVKEAKQFQKKCIVCPEGQRFSRRDGECLCKKNEQKDEKGNCVRCPKREIYKAGEGCTCIFNYYRHPKKKKCKPCKSVHDDPSCKVVENNA